MTKSRAMDQAMAAIARGQRKLLRRPQLLELGLSARSIQYRLDSGVLHLAHEPGVLRGRHGPTSTAR
jgi:hypothetical protein